MSQDTVCAITDPYPEFPTELKDVPRWVAWNSEDRNGKKTKVPYNPRTAKRATPTEQADWVDYKTAVEHALDFTGLGCVIVSPYVVIDLDKCHDPEKGVTEEWASQIIGEIDSYTELSPSGRGYHIWVKSKLPEGRRKAGRVEVYDGGRYFTVTGNRIAGTSAQIEARSLTSLHSRLTELDPKFKKSPKLPLRPAAPQSEQPPEVGVSKSKFELLKSGRWKEAGYPSQSEGDMALCILLARNCDYDPKKIDAEFRRSGMMRSKWERDDYRKSTIEKAIQVTKEKPTLEAVTEVVHDPIFRVPSEYPAWAWRGTEYANFADVCTRGNYIPREFPIEALKTVVGAAAGHLISVEGDENEARFYTVLIGWSGKGKSTSINYAIKALPASLVYTGGAPTWPELGCFMASFGS